MNKRIKILSVVGFLLSLITGVVVWAEDSAIFQTLNMNSATIAANTTNSVAGTAFQFADGQNTVRVFISGTTAATSGTLVVRLATASGSGQGGSVTTNEFESANNCLIKLTINPLASGVNTFGDWFNVNGARFIRVAQVENTSGSTVSNMTIRLGYNKSR